ncbi:MAG: ABC transporter ATP-binding protein [Deltaproteobacteria bacterium]
MSELMIETDGLTKILNGNKVLNEFNMKVSQGSICGLVGHNGAGKTTLIKILMGIIRPTFGTGYIMGSNIINVTGKVRECVGYISDSPGFYPKYSIQDLLNFYSMVYSKWNNEMCKNFIKNLDIPIDIKIEKLSKGARTQLALVIALSIQPKLLILDEPTNGLDPMMKKYFISAILDYAASENATVFFSTHNIYDIEKIADNVAVIAKGKLVFQRSVEDIRSNSRKIQVRFEENLPEEINNLKGILKIEKQENLFSIVINDNYNFIFNKIKSYNPQFIETSNMDIEEYFIQTIEREGITYEGIISK